MNKLQSVLKVRVWQRRYCRRIFSQSSMDTKPLFSFGIITDVQYADVDDGWDFHHLRLRRYRNAFKVLQAACQAWRSKGEISFILQLGDLLDGKCAQMKDQEVALALVLKEFEGFAVHHLIGNHELYNFSRKEFNQKLNKNPIDNKNAYYSVKVHPGWRLIVLDGYEFNIMEADLRDDAINYLKDRNPNEVWKNDVNWVKGLAGLQRRFLPYNGMMKKKQLEWLNTELADATVNKEKVIVSCHLPVCPGATGDSTLLWNYDEVLAILHAHTCVIAFLAGHDHEGGYKKDVKNIHHKTFEAALEAPLDCLPYATIKVYDDRLELEGEGTIESAMWNFKC